jgi:hypothetical protein
MAVHPVAAGPGALELETSELLHVALVGRNETAPAGEALRLVEPPVLLCIQQLLSVEPSRLRKSPNHSGTHRFKTVDLKITQLQEWLRRPIETKVMRYQARVCLELRDIPDECGASDFSAIKRSRRDQAGPGVGGKFLVCSTSRDISMTGRWRS